MLNTSNYKLTSGKDRFDRFLASPNYLVAIVLLTAIANIFSLELAVYGIFAAIVVYVCFFGKDLLPLTPLFICCYIAPSVENNPGRNQQTIFSGGMGVYILALGAVILVSVVRYVIVHRQDYLRRKYPLLPGMLLLLGGYLLSGIGSVGYTGNALRNIFFALLQGASILIPYLLLCGGVDWKSARKDYFAWIGFCVGGLLVVEILYIYRSANVVIDGVIHRDRIFTGWGIHNNLGGMLAMMLPFAFYLATKYQKGWIGTVVGSVFMIGLLLSCSRNAIFTGSFMYLVCVILMLLYARNRKGNTIAVITFSTVSLLVLLFLHKPILRLFSDLLSMGLDPSSRDSIFVEGLKLFGKAPVFGNSFFSPGFQPWDWATLDTFSSFFPPRWHNTIVQLLASCGIVGFAAYVFHRVQTVKLFLHNRSREAAFIGCSLLVLVICSLFDCHFFNIGPTMFYATALAFAENCNTE